MESQTSPAVPTEEPKETKIEDGVSEHSSSSSDAQDSTKPRQDSPDQSLGAANEKSGEPITKTESAVERDHIYLDGFKLYVVLAALTLVFFLVLMDMSILSTAIPRITDQFHSLDDVGWYGSAYNLASAALQPLTGKFYTHFKNKWTFLIFFALFELGSLLCGVANSSKMLIVARAVAGMGSSGLMNGSLTIITAAAPMQKRPVYTGILMAFAQLGLVCGPLVGGALTEFTTWRWCFYINLPIGGLVAGLLVWVNIPDASTKIEGKEGMKDFFRKLDVIGFVLFAPWAIMLLLALQWGGLQYAWDSATIIGLFCGAAGMIVIFAIWDWRAGENAMIPVYLVRQQVVWASCLVVTCTMAVTFLTSYYTPIYFQTVKGASPLMSGVYLLPSILPQMLFAVLSGALVSRLGYYIPWCIIGSILCSIGLGLMSTWSVTTPTGEWVGYQVLQSAGRGCLMQMPLLAIQSNLPLSKIPVAMSILVFCQTFGGAVFLSLAETILTNSLKTQVPVHAPQVDPALVIQAGATRVRNIGLPPQALFGVLQAYADSIDRIFYLAVGAACGVFAFSWLMKWTDIRKKKEPAKAEP